MCTSWLDFRNELCFSLRIKRNIEQFNRLRSGLPQALTTPEEVISFLASRDNDPAARDAGLRFLVTKVQEGKADAEIAFSILALGRWRDLDMIYYRECRRLAYMDDVNEVVSLIRVGFTTAILRTNLDRSHKLEANLSLSTERPLREWGQDLWETHQIMEHPFKDDRSYDPEEVIKKDDYGVESFEAPGMSRTSPFGFPTAMSEKERFEILNQLARQAAGDDADFVIAVDVCGLTLREAAARFGIGRAAAIKRYQKAKRKIQTVFEDNGLGPCPRSRQTPATTRCKGDVRPGGLR